MRWRLIGWSAMALVATASCDDGPGAEECYGICGPGTDCRAGTCVVDERADPAVPRDDAKADGKRKRKKGRRKGGGDPDEAVADLVPVDDSAVPKYSANRTQVIDMKGGSERLDDVVVNKHLRRLEGNVDACIATAAQHSAEEIKGGDIDIVFSIEPNGKVSGVTAKAPGHLKVLGIVPCVRKAIHSHRFPAFDGPSMGVDYTFSIK